MSRRIAVLAVLALALSLPSVVGVYASQAGDAYGELARHEDAQDARITALEAKVAALGATPLPVPTPTPSAAPTVAPTTATPTAGACPATVQATQAALDALPSGGTLNFTGCTFTWTGTTETTGRITMRKPMTLIGGTYRTAQIDGFAATIQISASDVTIDSIHIADGGAGIMVYGGDRNKVLRSRFAGLRGGALGLWGGTDDTLFDGNTVVQTEGCRVSPVGGRASEDGSVNAFRTRITNNVIDQGGRAGTTTCVANAEGWFGIELLHHDDAVISGNDLRGGHALISLPEAQRVMVAGNTLRLGPATGSDPATWGAYWGVEVAHANDVTVTDNDCAGTTQTFGACVSLNSGSLRSVITRNRAAQFVHYLVEGGGGGIVITDNCYAAGTIVQKFNQPGDTVARNSTPCGVNP